MVAALGIPRGGSALLALASAALLAGCAGADRTGAAPPAPSAAAQAKSEGEGARQCFFAREVTGYRLAEGEDGRADATRVLIDVGAGDTYEFELRRPCPDLRFARSIALVRDGPGRICNGLDVDLVVEEDTGPLRCPVTMVRKLAPAEPEMRVPPSG